uniref:multimerin-2a n=1 Tax=Semicossyphus pulcher TaxID=241346 RepID=UPI0037E820CC
MWLGADMAAVGELVLVLGLLVSAHCEVRARDPEVEEEEEELGGRAAAGGGGGGGAFPTHLEGLPPGATETPSFGERGNHQARMGNWCAFVQKRMVTTAMACGTEPYIIKSHSLCPSGTPDCQLVMYKMSTRPVYRLKQQIFTALLWHCCPGHGGENCEDTDSDVQLDSGDSALSGGSEAVRTELHASGVQAKLQLQRGDPNREQNDHQALYDTAYTENKHNTTHPALDPGLTHKTHHASHHAANTHDHQHQQTHQHTHGQQQEQQQRDHVDATALPYQEASAALPVPHMMALVMSQLRPVLEGFNHSLEHLSRQVGDLARDVAQLKSNQMMAELEADLQAEPADVPEPDEAVEERLNTRLDEVFEQVREVRRQMESQQTDMENRLHSQHAMLHYNLTSFKTDIDMKLKRHQKMLQVSLQAMNTTLAELKLDQDQIEDQLEDQLEDHLLPPFRPPLQPPSDTSVLWKAIERLDNMVVNNTVKVGGLMEDLEVTSGSVQQLRQDFKELGKQINQTARNSQIQFMETGLEVEAARETVLRRVGELAGNLSLQGVRLQEVDMDLDYLYTILYKHNSTGDCDCKGLKAAVARLERGVANVTELANENRLALEEDSEGGTGQWGGASDWEPAVGELQKSFQQVKEILTSEQNRTTSLEQSLTQLSSSVTVGLADISGLKVVNTKLVEDMKHLTGSFNSLLKDAIRHSDVLELLLGEEVLEFLEWPVQDQEASSVPALKEQLSLLQEQLREHNLSITSLLGNRPGDREEVPSADQPPSSSHILPEDWLPGSTRRSSSGVPARERQLLLHPEGMRPMHIGDGSDLWNLEKTVEELGQKVLLLEEKQRNASTQREAPPGGVEAKLQAEVMWLKRGLEEHLRVFKNVFSNADVLVGSDATLELDKLWQLVKNRDGKKERKRGGGREGSGRGGNHRSRRELSGVVPVPYSQSDDSLLLVAGSPLSVSNGVIVLEASLNRGQFYSDTGTFTAPVNGIYLFVLTLDLRPGPAHVVLRRGSSGAQVSLHRWEVTEAGPVTEVSLLLLSEGEEVRLELRGGAWAESEDNVFTALLLHRTT